MVNKSIKGLVLALGMIAFGTARPNSGGDNNVVNCCVQSGQTVTVTNCNCTVNVGSGSRARGDVVMLDLQGITPTQLKTEMNAKDTIQIPQVGSIDLYQYGQIRIAVASFSLTNQSQNPKNLSPALKRIINAAAANNKWAKSMVWVGRALPKETAWTEVTESYSDLADLSQADPITYQAINSKTVKVILPGAKGAKAQELEIDFNPIKKQ